MNQRRLLILAPLLICLPGCATSFRNQADDGPGMTVTFTSMIEGRSISIKSAVLPNGGAFSNPGGFGGHRRANWRTSGATMGAAPDGRQLPEWVTFTWSEPVYPEDPHQTLEQYRALPRKTARVEVRSRVPQEVIAEVIGSNHNRAPHKLPDKSLWVYFVWHDSGIRFHWELKSDCCGVLRSGGDVIGDGN